MTGDNPARLAEGLYAFDLFEQQLPGRTSAYVFTGPKTMLVDTGSSPSHPHLLSGLEKLGLSAEDLDYVVITHVHLDHGGGAGLLAQAAPKATFVAHPRAARHLADPSRLIAGARAVYGEAFDRFFAPVLPVPKERILVREDGETLNLSGRSLTFYDTPGHAKHHFSMHDPELRAIFSGDALGIRYVKKFTGWDFELILPSTSPTDFDPEAVEHTVRKLSALGADTVFHAHYGPSPAEEALRDTLSGAAAFSALAHSLDRPGLPWQEVEAGLVRQIGARLEEIGHPGARDLSPLGIDLELNAKGLLHYLETRRPAPPGPS